MTFKFQASPCWALFSALILLVSVPAHAQEAQTPISPAELAALTTKAQQGDAQAEFTLGVGYFTGAAGSVDHGKAVAWLQKSADAGHAYAQANLASLYISGVGVPKDDVAAFSYFQKAAMAGLAKAQDNVAYMYAVGMGVDQNYKMAYVWYDLASRNGMPEDAQMRDTALMNMPLNEIDNARKLAGALDPHKPVFP